QEWPTIALRVKDLLHRGNKEFDVTFAYSGTTEPVTLAIQWPRVTEYLTESSAEILESSEFNPRPTHSDSFQSTIYDPPDQTTSETMVNPCKVTVIQRADGELVLGRHEHNHQGQVVAGLAAKITAKMKAEAKKNLFKPAMVIVNEV
ncbi:unnamed protein product, partial [Porites evermanni]